MPLRALVVDLTHKGPNSSIGVEDLDPWADRIGPGSRQRLISLIQSPFLPGSLQFGQLFLPFLDGRLIGQVSIGTGEYRLSLGEIVLVDCRVGRRQIIIEHLRDALRSIRIAGLQVLYLTIQLRRPVSLFRAGARARYGLARRRQFGQFDVQPTEFVCEFGSGNRFTYEFDSDGVEYACADAATDASITIEVAGVRSATITR